MAGQIPNETPRPSSLFGVELCVSRTVRDTAAMLDAVAGPGIGDTVVAPAPARPYLREVGADPGLLRIGLLDHLPSGEPVHEQCAAAVHQTARLLESLGHHVEVDFPSPLGDPQYRKRIAPLGSTMMSTTLYRLGRILGREVTAADVEPVNWQRAMQARDLTAVDHAHALAARAQFRRAVHQWWAEGFDLLLTPTIDEPPEPIDPAAPTVVDPKLQRSARTAVFTHPFNATGQPAITLPVHWTPDGLPVGVQLVAAYGNEATLIQVASQLEQAQPWTTRRPSI